MTQAEQYAAAVADRLAIGWNSDTARIHDWWNRAHATLGGRTPRQAIEDDGAGVLAIAENDAEREDPMPEVRNPCPVPGCSNTQPRSHLMCKPHWMKVPTQIRADVWRTYRQDGVLSENYLAARDAAIESVSSE